MKRIMILNGSPRKNGKTASLVRSFTEGALSSGNEVKEFYIDGMAIKSCKGCDACMTNGGNCVQKDDDMSLIYDCFEWCDVMVLASPMYWGTVTGQLKIVVDRLFAAQHRTGAFGGAKKGFVMLMTARGSHYDMTLDFCSIFTQMMGWPDCGKVLGAGKEEEARALGAGIS